MYRDQACLRSRIKAIILLPSVFYTISVLLRQRAIHKIYKPLLFLTFASVLSYFHFCFLLVSFLSRFNLISVLYEFSILLNSVLFLYYLCILLNSIQVVLVSSLELLNSTSILSLSNLNLSFASLLSIFYSPSTFRLTYSVSSLISLYLLYIRSCSYFLSLFHIKSYSSYLGVLKVPIRSQLYNLSFSLDRTAA